MIRSSSCLTAAALLVLVPVVALAATPAAAPAKSRGETALKSSVYLNTVPTLVSMVTDTRKDMLDALETDAKKRAVIEKALSEVWSEKRLNANAAALLEKQMPPSALDSAISQMTPEVQTMIRDGIVEATPEQAKAWLTAARKLPDAKERDALARRIAQHMPKAAAFKTLMSQVPELWADVAQLTSGADDSREEFVKTMMSEMEPIFAAMGQPEAMVISTVIAYREHPTAKMKTLADALDTEDGRTLQTAALDSLIGATKQTRAELVARLQKDLKAPAKKK